MCTVEITQQDLVDVLEIFEKKAYEAGSCEETSTEYTFLRNCERLFRADYSISELDNINGILCPRYPSRILIPEYERSYHYGNVAVNSNPSSLNTAVNGLSIQNNSSDGTQNGSNNGGTTKGFHTYLTFAGLNSGPSHPQQTIYEDSYDNTRFRELITMAKYARCRQRFVVPVILYKGRYICRSATISVSPETYGRKVVNYAYNCLNNTTMPTPMVPPPDDEPSEDSLANSGSEPPPFSYEEVIKSDVQLMKILNVSTVVDLMVEYRKIKYFVTVSSSEKADSDNYKGFNVLILPYPGCEFFALFRDHNYVASELFFNWNQTFIDAELNIPKCLPASELDLEWTGYRSWNLLCMTQNYMKAILKCIHEDSAGVLIHCISGWDRTPLFISLVRLSLWADGLIHQSLSPLQMTYLTVVYDWYLFGHQLPDRMKRNEDIMFFCFHILKHLVDDDYSIVEQSRKRTKTSSSSSGSTISSASCSSSGGIVVIRPDGTEDDVLREDIILEDSNDSNSNFSNCDTNDRPQTPNNNLTNRSPNAKRTKTSPISVPMGSRQRHESVSSNGSWQHVTETGSLDSTMNSSFGNQGDSSNGMNGSNSSKSEKLESSMRKQRLDAVRAIFIQSYAKGIGLKFKEGSSLTLSSLLGSLSDQIFM